MAAHRAVRANEKTGIRRWCSAFTDHRVRLVPPVTLHALPRVRGVRGARRGRRTHVRQRAAARLPPLPTPRGDPRVRRAARRVARVGPRTLRGVGRRARQARARLARWIDYTVSASGEDPRRRLFFDEELSFDWGTIGGHADPLRVESDSDVNVPVRVDTDRHRPHDPYPVASLPSTWSTGLDRAVSGKGRRPLPVTGQWNEATAGDCESTASVGGSDRNQPGMR